MFSLICCIISLIGCLITLIGCLIRLISEIDSLIGCLISLMGGIIGGQIMMLRMLGQYSVLEEKNITSNFCQSIL